MPVCELDQNLDPPPGICNSMCLVRMPNCSLDKRVNQQKSKNQVYAGKARTDIQYESPRMILFGCTRWSA